MEFFGSKVKTARKCQGMSQAVLAGITGLGQPRLSRIENSELPASAEVIDKVASALGKTGRDLASGTDREEYYLSMTMSPEQRTLERSFMLVTLSEAYQRIFDLFEALYGGWSGITSPDT